MDGSTHDEKVYGSIVTEVFLLPSGIGERAYIMRVAEGRKDWKIIVDWPFNPTYVKVTHRKWLERNGSDKIEAYNPNINVF